jgi:hypothetical protein
MVGTKSLVKPQSLGSIDIHLLPRSGSLYTRPGGHGIALPRRKNGSIKVSYHAQFNLLIRRDCCHRILVCSGSLQPAAHAATMSASRSLKALAGCQNGLAEGFVYSHWNQSCPTGLGNALGIDSGNNHGCKDNRVRLINNCLVVGFGI